MSKYKYLEPSAREAINYAKKRKIKSIVMMVDGFITDKEALFLRDMLWYARDNRVAIHMIPKEEIKK